MLSINKICLVCNKEFFVIPFRKNTAICCSRKCYHKYCKLHPNKGTFKKGQHPSPATEFKKGQISPYKGKSKPKGNKAPNWRGGKIKIICQNCGKEFNIFPSHLKNRKFCSKKCFYTSHYYKSNCNGYITINKNLLSIKEQKKFKSMFRKDNNCKEHRIIASRLLKRPLLQKEIIHHINGIKTDNHPENLYLFNNNKEHIEYHNNLYSLKSNII